MFTDLFDLSLIRTNKQALGFYLAYFLMLTMSSGLLGFLFASDYDSGFIIGQVYAVIINPVICFMILYSKNLMSNFALIILSILSGILTMIGGSLLGLIPAAYLTTKGLDN